MAIADDAGDEIPPIYFQIGGVLMLLAAAYTFFKPEKRGDGPLTSSEVRAALHRLRTPLMIPSALSHTGERHPAHVGDHEDAACGGGGCAPLQEHSEALVGGVNQRRQRFLLAYFPSLVLGDKRQKLHGGGDGGGEMTLPPPYHGQPVSTAFPHGELVNFWSHSP